MLIEATSYQAGQGVQGRLGVRTVGLQLEPRAALGGECRQVEDTLPAHRAIAAGNLDTRPELPGELDEFVGRPEMEAEAVDHIDLSSDRADGAIACDDSPGLKVPADWANPAGCPTRKAA